MRSFIISFRRSVGLTMTIFCVLALQASNGRADDSHLLADLLEQPAQANTRATFSLQLSVCRAGDRLVSVGERGLILLSDDSGRSWRQAKSVPVSVALTQVYFVSAKTGWAIGHSGVVLHSEDGGDTWQRQLDGRQVAQIVLYKAHSLATTNGDARVARLRAAEQLVQDGPDKPFLSLYFTDAQNGWIVGAYGLALATKDGGKSWQSLMAGIPNVGSKHFYAVSQSKDNLLIAGEQGALFRSTNQGESFTQLQTPYSGTYFGVLQSGPDVILAFGLRGNVWRSHDAGTSWSRVELGQSVTITAGLQLPDGTALLADESGQLFHGDAMFSHFTPLKVPALSGLTSMVQTIDGGLAVTSMRGVSRIEPAMLATERSQ